MLQKGYPMTTNGFWMAKPVLAGVLLAAGVAWGQDKVAVVPEAVPAVEEAPAPAVEEVAGDPLEEAAARGARKALAALGGFARDGLSAEAIELAVLEAVLRAGDPGVGFEVPQAGNWTYGMVLVGTEGLPRVAWVAPGSAADGAGIKAGDWIDEVGGATVADGPDLSEVRAALAGGEEAEIPVKVLPGDGGEVREVVLERGRKDEVPGLAGVERLPTGIGYLRLERIEAGAAEEVVQALAAWEEEGQVPAGMVLDLRGADGDAAAEGEVVGIAGRFALPGKILYRVDEGTAAARTVAVGAFPGERVRKPLVVLVDEGTSGAAELLAIALGGAGEGVLVVGRETSGNPLVREVVELGDGRKALLAVHAVTDASGHRHDGRAGLAPALEIGGQALAETVYEPEEPVLRKGKSLSEEEKEDRALRDRTRHDPYLRRATDVLLGLQALGHEWR
ncbi:MAG: hypothetical protein IKQ55_10135 [Kiritimatiellae bacterium]|nr:hypothetical protein [Kiritimatiellia bacterium]